MLHDVVIVGAGPVGATLALALAGGDLDVVALDARARGDTLRGDRSLALSHGARLIFERLGVWSAARGARAGAVTPITAIDISQRGGFGTARLDAHEHGVPALGYVVSYRALQAALDAALARARPAGALTASPSRRSAATPAYARIRGEREGAACEWTARLAAVADGGGDVVAGNVRAAPRLRAGRADRASSGGDAPHRGVAYERFTPDGPMALLPEGDHYGLVWTTTPAQAQSACGAAGRARSSPRWRRDFGARVGGFLRARIGARFRWRSSSRGDRRRRAHASLLGNAAQTLHPVAGQGFNLGLRDAYELAQAIARRAARATRRRARCSRAYARAPPPIAAPASRSRTACVSVFGNDARAAALAARVGAHSARRAAAAKRAFTRAMLFGLR